MSRSPTAALSPPTPGTDAGSATAGEADGGQPQPLTEHEARALRCAYLGTSIDSVCRVAVEDIITKERASDYSDTRAAAAFFGEVCRHAGLYARNNCSKKGKVGFFVDSSQTPCEQLADQISISVLTTCKVGTEHARGLRDVSKSCFALFEATRKQSKSTCDRTTEE